MFYKKITGATAWHRERVEFFLENGYCQSKAAGCRHKCCIRCCRGQQQHLLFANFVSFGKSPTILVSFCTDYIVLTSPVFVRIQQQWNQINFAKCAVLYKGEDASRTL